MLTFDVVIPTKNRSEDLKRLLWSIEKQTVLPSNIIIIDQTASDDEIEYYSSKLYNVIHRHSLDVDGLTAAKNMGIKYCNSEVIFFFDDDIILDNNFFEMILNYFHHDSELYGICGRQKNSKSSRFKLIIFNLFHVGPFYDIRKKCNTGQVDNELVLTKILPGGITAYRSSIFQIFLFDEVLIRYCLGEDMDFSYRVSSKFKLAFATQALALHNHSAIGRYDAVESFACKVSGYSYFYKKNVRKTLINKLSYYLVELGVIFDALQYSILNKNLKAIIGIIKGFKCVRNNFKDVPFISYEKLKRLNG